MANKKKAKKSGREVIRKGGEFQFGHHKDELQAFVVSRYCEGLGVTPIINELVTWLRSEGEDQVDFEVSESIVRSEVLKARKAGRLIYEPGRDETLANSLVTTWRKLVATRNDSMRNPQGVVRGDAEDFGGAGKLKAEVLLTTEAIDVARAGARKLHDEIIEHFRKDPGRTDLHIGFAGGRTPSLMAKELAAILSAPDQWPESIYAASPKRVLNFYSLVGNLNSNRPEVDPNSFLIYLATAGRDSGSLPFELRFFSLPAPGVVTREEYRLLKGRAGTTPDGKRRGGFGLIDAAFERNTNLDIVIVSCGHWGPKHNSVYDYLESVCAGNKKLETAWRQTAAALDEQDILGDIMWWPVGPEGPFRIPHSLRVLSLIDIFDLPAIVNPRPMRDGSPERRPGQVILLVGPCCGPEGGPPCRRSKGRLLGGIMEMRRLPMSHVIVDSRSARECIKHLEEKIAVGSDAS